MVWHRWRLLDMARFCITLDKSFVKRRWLCFTKCRGGRSFHKHLVLHSLWSLNISEGVIFYKNYVVWSLVRAFHKPYGFMKCQLSHPPGIQRGMFLLYPGVYLKMNPDKFFFQFPKIWLAFRTKPNELNRMPVRSSYGTYKWQVDEHLMLGINGNLDEFR